MAGKGTYTAYQKLKPIEADFGEIARHNAEQSLARRKQSQSEAKDRQAQRDKIDFDVIEPVITGVDTLDKGIGLGIEKASTMQHEDFKKAMNDPVFANSPEYKIRNKNFDNYSKTIKKMTDATTELAGKLIAKSNDGTISAWDDELLNTMNGAFVSEAVVFGVKEDGSLLTTIAMTDQELISEDNPRGFVKDEDDKIRMVQVTPAEVFKGLGMFSITADKDIPKIALGIGEKLGKSITSKIDGYEITSEQSWETKKEETRKIIQGMLGTHNAPTDLTKRLWADSMGRDSRKLTEENMKEIEDNFLAKIKPYYDEEVKKTKNYTSQEKARGRHDDKNKNKIKAEFVVNPETGVPTITKINGVDANIISFGDGKGIEVVTSESSKESIQNIYVDANGDIYADKILETKIKGDPPIDPETGKADMKAWALQGKGWETKKENKVKMDMKDFTNLAKSRAMVDENGNPFKDGKELSDYLKRRKALLPKGEKLKGVGSKYNPVKEEDN